MLEWVYKTTKVSELKPASYNPRSIDKDEFEGLKESLKTFGFADPVVVNSNNNVIVGGHQRIKAWEALGNKEVPTMQAPLTEEQEKKLNVVLNSQAISGGYDELLLSELLEDMKLDDDYEALRLDKLEPLDLSSAEIEEDEAPEISQEPPKSELGKVYQLGRHRVMCGDSTDAGSVAILMDGNKSDMVFTDPPYGINLDGDNSKRGKSTSLMKGGLKLDSFIDDSTSYAIDAWNICQDLKIPVQVWFGANYYCHSLPETNNWLVWDKRVEDKMTNTNSDCELAWVQDGHNSVRIFRHLWNGLIKASEKSDKRVHPTQKPMALAQFAFEKYDPTGKTVLDLFLGSGSTLIACEQTDRTCYGMELDPKYADVIRKRYAKFTNNNELPENWEELTKEVA